MICQEEFYMRHTINVVVTKLWPDPYYTLPQNYIISDNRVVLPWNYYRIPEVTGRGKSFLIETEWQFEKALLAAENVHSKELCILDVRLGIHDGSPALQRLTETLGKKVQ